MRLVLMALGVSALAGCADVYPPATVADPVTIGLVNYGRHTSLLLPDEGDNVVEWGYGDWSFCAVGKRGLHIELGAVLLPTSGALGRRAFDAPLDATTVREALGDYKISPIVVDRAKAAALHEQLNQRFAERADEALYAEDFDMTFVPAGATYGAWSTCNNIIARWLRSLDCEVRGCTQTSSFVIHKPPTATR